MRYIRKKTILLLVLLNSTWMCFLIFSQINRIDIARIPLNPELEDKVIENQYYPRSSDTLSNYDILTNIFTEKLTEHNSVGYFKQVYQPSLQATYYILYIMKAIGYLDAVNSTAILNFIWSHYNEQTGLFEDAYSNRYLDSAFSVIYYPLATVLEVNCYTILSLELLNQLNSIANQHFIDFIWSCYNPEGSYNGFIGQPYNLNLEDPFKIATMDNTYYAVRALNILLDDWGPYTSQKARIIQFIDNLQSTGNYAGFSNDMNSDFNSLQINDPNLLSSYFCLKTLEIFGMLEIIQTNEFNQFLDATYNNDEYYFDMYPNPFSPNTTNIMATALGLELSGITNFEGINREEVINFLLQQRRGSGGWYTSTSNRNYDLIDTFYVIGSLLNANEVARLSTMDKNTLFDFLSLFSQYDGGYSLMSKEYISVDLIHTIVSSFDLFNRIPDLSIQELYDSLCSAYWSDVHNYRFTSYCPLDPSSPFLRSFPIEYHCISTSQVSHLFNTPISHKATFEALDAMQKLFKLNDFASCYDLNGFIQNVIDTQLINTDSKYHGAFLPFEGIHPNIQEIFVQLEYSYYAIRILELVNNYLNLGALIDFGFNKGALLTFITNRIAETDRFLYFNWSSYDKPEKALENTYYMIYILKALNLYDLNSKKIENYLINHLNYDNTKILYYSYKISEILNLNITFNLDLTNNLVKKLYSEELNEFYLDTTLSVIYPETFLWFSEMARNDEPRIICSYSSKINLGSVAKITATFRNLILNDFGPYCEVKFETDQLGILKFEKQSNNFFELNLYVPIHPNMFPQITGQLKILDGLRTIGQIPLILQTTVNQTIDHILTKNENHVNIEVNISRCFSYQSQPVSNANVQLEVFRNDHYLETRNLNHEIFPDHSYFFLNYELTQGQLYHFKFSLFDDFYPMGLFIFEHRVDANSNVAPNNQPHFVLTGPILAFAALGLGIVLTSLTVLIAHVVKTKKQKKNETDSKKATIQRNIKTLEIDSNAQELGNRMKQAFFKSNN